MVDFARTGLPDDPQNFARPDRYRDRACADHLGAAAAQQAVENGGPAVANRHALDG
jgi:hypothetical protein